MIARQFTINFFSLRPLAAFPADTGKNARAPFLTWKKKVRNAARYLIKNTLRSPTIGHWRTSVALLSFGRPIFCSKRFGTFSSNLLLRRNLLCRFFWGFLWGFLSVFCKHFESLILSILRALSCVFRVPSLLWRIPTPELRKWKFICSETSLAELLNFSSWHFFIFSQSLKVAFGRKSNGFFWRSEGTVSLTKRLE